MIINSQKVKFQIYNSNIVFNNNYTSSFGKCQIMGSCCIQSKQTLRHRTFEKAYSLFLKIALPSQKIINKQAVEQYFTDYTKSCYDILMREIDFNNDGIITQNEWMAYWQYIRKSGYELTNIQKQLHRIQKGQISLSFPKARNYQPHQPRITLLGGIINEMKQDGTAISFLATIPEQ